MHPPECWSDFSFFISFKWVKLGGRVPAELPVATCMLPFKSWLDYNYFIQVDNLPHKHPNSWVAVTIWGVGGVNLYEVKKDKSGLQFEVAE